MTQSRHPGVERLEDLAGDLASTHRQPAPPQQPDPTTVADLARLDRDGFIVLDALLDEDQVSAICQAIGPHLGPTGRNGFEGERTQRVYSLLAKTRELDVLVEHPRILAIVDRILGSGALLSQLQAINILPGETAQLLHPDDGMYPVPRPRAPLGIATVWALTPFTDANGATVVIPGSHRWEDRTPTEADEPRAVVMSPGSCVVFVGTLWHGGGANRTSLPRLGVTAQYCAAWLRPQETFTLSVPQKVARECSPRLRRLFGYSIYPPFIGMVDGRHPQRLLDAADKK